MILDTERNPKSPTVSNPGSLQTSTQPGNSIFSHSSQYPISYSTFSQGPSGRANTGAYTNSISDITGLLSQDHPNAIPDDDLPPAYHEITTSSSSRKSNRLWARFAGIFLIVLLTGSTWYAYEFAGAGKSGRNTPSPLPPSPSPSNVPPPVPPLPPSSFPTSSPSAPTPLPKPPPAEPNPNKPYLSPTSGRGDLCRPWGYTTNTRSQPSIYEHTSTEHLEYIVPTSAPIHIENSATCTSDGKGTKCTGSMNAIDSVTASLLVIPADIPRPKVELHIQYASEELLENVSICMTKQYLGDEDKTNGGEDYRWVLGINANPGVGMLSSINVIVTLPTSQRHDFSTDLKSFKQTIGYPAGASPYKLMFGALHISGDFGDVGVWELSSGVVEVTSGSGNIEMEGLRVSGLIKTFSEYGNVECNATLVHGYNGPPVQVDNRSIAGVVATIVSIEYPSQISHPPVFNVNSHSQFGRAWTMTRDPIGTASLRTGRLPSVLPTIRTNVTSTYGVAQVVVPSTYYGSLDLSSLLASVVKVDHAKDLPGRSIKWYTGADGAHRGVVQWDGRHQGEKGGGSVHVATQYAVARLLFLGLNDDGTERWPSE
ncbi:hypothetical protein BDV93DRAFT_527935 [Ceratobasidium sp. AG-I]|nr:hypothetical protein BDV93DRAFT_527935 [Ceratobasidium sp. AG-I]